MAFETANEGDLRGWSNGVVMLFGPPLQHSSTPIVFSSVPCGGRKDLIYLEAPLGESLFISVVEHGFQDNSIFLDRVRPGIGAEESAFFFLFRPKPC